MGPTSDREKWDARWAKGAGGDPGRSDSFVLRALEALGPGHGRRALELAAGLGRHALEMARRGYAAEAWDVSPVALAKLERLARAAGLAVETRCVDLAGGSLSAERAFDLVVTVNFLDRDFLRACPEIIRPGGHLLFATFTVDWPGEHPRRPEWRLARGELAAGLPGFETVLSEERGGRAGILGRRVPSP